MTTLANLTTYISGESQSFLTALDKTRGGLRSLIASLDPVATATARYNRQVDLLDKGLKNNQITAQQHATFLQRLSARYQEQVRGQAAVTGATGQMRAGMQQLGFQLGDVATQFASGTKPMIIFAQQGSQVIQAIQLMTNSSKGFLGFLSGPWGQVLTAATVVVAALSAKLFENGEAAKAAELGNDGLADAQSVLGRMFDLTSGKLQNQNELLRLNAQLTSANLKAEAAAARTRAEGAARSASVTPLESAMMLLGRQRGVGAAQQLGERVRTALEGVISGKLQADRVQADPELRGAANAVGLSGEAFDAAIRDAVEARFKQQTAAEIDSTLATGRLSGVFRQDGRTKKVPADRTDQREERFDDQLARLKAEQASLQMAITSDMRLRANIERDQVQAEMEAYRIDLDHQVAQKEITAERAKELLAVRQRNAELEITRINWRLDDQITQDELAARREGLNAANDNLRSALDSARTQDERRRIQLQILDNEQALERATIEAIKATHATTDAEYQRAQARLGFLDQQRANGRAAIERGTMGAGGRYLDGLIQSAGEAREALEDVQVSGLRALEDGLTGVIAGTQSVGQAFGRMAESIIADLARIGIQRAIIEPLANSLFGGGAGGLNLMSSADVARALPFSYSVPAPRPFANGGSFRIGGLQGVDRNMMSINGYPVASVSRDEVVSISNENVSDTGGGRMEFHMHVAGGVDLATRKEAMAYGRAAAAEVQYRMDERKRRAG